MKFGLRHGFLFATCCICLSAAPAALKHPASAPTAAAPASVTAPSPVPDLRGTKDHPVLVAVAPDEGKQSDDHTLAKWTVWLGVATIALAIIGGLQLVLVFIQLRMMKEGAKDTELAAKAAEKAAAAADRSAAVSEKALYDLERPFISVSVSDPGFKVQPGNGPHGGVLERTRTTLSVNNYGRTPAILSELHWAVICVARSEDVPSVDPDTYNSRKLPAGIISVAGKPFLESHNNALWHMDRTEGIITGEQKIWIYGFTRYRDLFGRAHVTGFTFIFDEISNRFLEMGDHLRNYTREEKETTQFEPADQALTTGRVEGPHIVAV